MPDYAYLYAIPYELYKKYGVRRYGFHGTSHRYVSQRVCEYLGVSPEGKKIITCHIGNGGSITAVKDGKSIDTSMGLTPLEGLMMGTRSGDIDAGAVTFIMEKENLTAAGVSDLLNKKSGVKGIFGVSSDMRELEAAVAAGNNKMADLTEKMYFYRIKKVYRCLCCCFGWRRHHRIYRWCRREPGFLSFRCMRRFGIHGREAGSGEEQDSWRRSSDFC